MLASIVINIFMKGLMFMILQMIETLQLTIHLPLINIAMPANVIMMFKILVPLVTFDILDDLGLFEMVFPDSEEDSEASMDKIRQI